MFSIFIGIALILLLFGMGTLRFGGVAPFMAFIKGESVYFPYKLLDLGKCEAGVETVAVFKMHNLSSKEISIVGEKSSCSCAFSEQMPITAAHGKTIDLKINVHLPKYSSSYDQMVVFMVAEPNRLAMHPVRITATIPNPLPVPVEESEPVPKESEKN